ncbi:MAG: class I SAM-dependent methyltransferase [Hyphomicrobiaceae bacterium]
MSEAGRSGGLVAPDAAHAAHMDTIYRYQRHVYDATRKFYLLGRDGLIAGLEVPPGGRVLEVACGTGRNLALIAKRYPSARLFGFDVSQEMLTTARAKLAQAGLTDRVRLAQADAAAFASGATFGVDSFDRVVISYALSMIPCWQDAARCALDAVAPGGSLHIVDFGCQRRLPGVFRAGLQGWLAKFSVTPRSDLEAQLAVIAAEAGARLDYTELFRDYARMAVIRR